MLEVIKPHVYGGKRRKIGDRYEIKVGVHRRLFIALGWVREIFEYRTTVVPSIAAYQTTAMRTEQTTAIATDVVIESASEDPGEFASEEKPKRRYTRRIKTDDADE